uniref:Catenin delta-1 n=1 Tax=Phallusia mammillata TaxID=59560 RepID=A0A6F9DAQ9_9ASCI|nr:catenin delta-1 [Phallusia mammillata]
MATTVESRHLIQSEGSVSDNSEDLGMDEDSHASILASVREQEHQFAQLTKEIEKERKTVAQQLNHDQYGNDGEYADSMNSDSYYEPQQQEYVSRTEDYSSPQEETEVLIDENGVAKTVTKRTVTKTVTEQRVRHIEEHHGSLPRNGSNGPRLGSDRDNHYGSTKRNQHPTNQYNSETQPIMGHRSSASSSGSEPPMRKPSDSHQRPTHDQYGYAEVRRQTPEKFQPEDYGLEDDRHSDYDDDNDQYGLEPSGYREQRRRGSVSSEASSTGRYAQIDESMPVAAPRMAQKFGARAPLAEQEAGSRGSLDRLGPNWVNPTLPEVIKMLSYNMPVVQQNAAGYIQHLCFNNDKIKADVRTLGGIPPLVKLLDHPNEKVELNACGALRNLCYGSKNDDNKIKIKNCEGVPSVVRLIRATKNTQIREQATGTLWNLSAHPELKGQVLELGLEPLNNLVIVPYAEAYSKQDGKAKEVEMVDVFTNAVGVIRNLSSTDSAESRRRLRECPELVYSLISVLQSNIDNGMAENKDTENCICVLRNLTFHLQEETPNKDLYTLDNRASANTSDQSDTNCFGKSKPKDKPAVVEEVPPDDPDATGASLLWQPDISRLYVGLLQECKKGDDITEAALGAIQNLTNGTWKWSVYSRIVIRKEKGLPIIIDKLRTNNDQVVRAGTIALTNLAEGIKNKELIGKFAMKDLVYKLPGGSDPNVRLSDLTTIALLNTIRSLVDQSAPNTKNLQEAGGIERITIINNPRDVGQYHQRVVKAAGQLLKAIWANKDVRSSLKKDGWKKEHFIPTVTAETLPRGAGNKPYEEPRSTPNASSSGGRRAQRNASQSAEEVPLKSTEGDTVDGGKPKGPADSWV